MMAKQIGRYRVAGVDSGIDYKAFYVGDAQPDQLALARELRINPESIGQPPCANRPWAMRSRLPLPRSIR